MNTPIAVRLTCPIVSIQLRHWLCLHRPNSHKQQSKQTFFAPFVVGLLITTVVHQTELVLTCNCVNLPARPVDSTVPLNRGEHNGLSSPCWRLTRARWREHTRIYASERASSHNPYNFISRLYASHSQSIIILTRKESVAFRTHITGKGSSSAQKCQKHFFCEHQELARMAPDNEQL